MTFVRYSLNRLSPLLWVLLLAATTASAQQATPAAPEIQNDSSRNLPDPRQEQMAMLAKAQSPDTEVVWLETKMEAFLGLFHPANAAKPQGATLILHHDRTSPDWPEMVHAIRTQLPDQGWHSLSIAMPEEPRPSAPLRTASASDDSQPAANGEPNSYEEKVFERMDAAISHLEEKNPPRLLLVGVGTGAYWASRYVSEKGSSKRYLLILIDARPPLTPLKPDLAEAVAKIKIPTADLLHSSLADQTLMNHLAERRLNEAKRDARPFYLQRKLPGRPSGSDQSSQVLINALKGVIQNRLLKMLPSPLLKSTSKNSNLRPG